MTEPEPDEPNEPDQAVPDGDCADVAEAEAQICAAIEKQIGLEKQDLLLVKMLGDTVDKLRDMTGEDDSGRVRFAAERALVAVAERVARVFRRDLMADKG